MLYILTGSDVVKAKARAMKLADKSEVVRFGEGGEAFANVGSYLSARGLFASKVSLILDRPLDDPGGAALFTPERIQELADAGALVIAIAPDIHSDVLKNIRIGKTVVVEEFELKEKDNEPAPNVFALTDAFAAGDRKKSWILYRQMIEDGASAEEIHGALSWQARAMVLATKTKSAEEAGMKSYPYGKAKANTRGPW